MFESFEQFAKWFELFESLQSCLNVHKVVHRCSNMFKHVCKAH
jgi:hypothetical protein